MKSPMITALLPTDPPSAQYRAREREMPISLSVQHKPGDMKQTTARRLARLLANLTMLSVLASPARGDSVLSLTFATNCISETQVENATVATVGIDLAPTNSLRVLVFNAYPSQVSVPATVTIPAGSNTVSFGINAVNNGEVDGTRSIVLTVDADGCTPASATLTITDDDTFAHRTIGGKLFGRLSTNTYWVTANLLIEPDRTLSIDPGSSLRFSSGVGLTNAGSLVAVGAPGAPISFTAAADHPNNGIWVGLTVTSSGQPQTILDRAEIAFAQTSLFVVPSGNESSVLVTNCDIHDCSSYGIYVLATVGLTIDASAVEVLSNHIHDNGIYGVAIRSLLAPSTSATGCDSARNSATLIGNEIYANASAGVRLNADTGGNWGCLSTRRSRVDGLVSNNKIHGNLYGIWGRANKGLYATIGTVNSTICNNFIINNTADAIRFDAATGVYKGAIAELLPVVVNNTILENGGSGISHATNVVSGFILENNLVATNTFGIRADLWFSATNAIVAFNDVWANVQNNWVNYSPSYGTPVTTNMNDTPADAAMNICEDPLTLRPKDFHISPLSPLVDAGATNRASMVDFEGRPRGLYPDIGCQEVLEPWLALSGAPTGGALQLTLTGGRGLHYSVETSADLQHWATGTTNVMTTNRVTTVPVGVPNGDSMRSWRTRLQ